MGSSTRDAELVEGFVRTREPRLFEELVKRHRARVVRLVVSILGPALAGEAEDVVQNVFVHVLDRLDAFRRQSEFGTWLYRIAYNRALDHKRSAERRMRRAGRSLAEAPAPVGATEAGAAERIVAAERDRAVASALAQLPPLYQAALRLHYWLDQPVAEIAETLGVAPGTVKSYLYRGRARLARLLARAGVAP